LWQLLLIPLAFASLLGGFAQNEAMLANAPLREGPMLRVAEVLEERLGG
jgi:hypothetical protein